MKLFLIVLFSFLFLGSQWVAVAEEEPYVPNIRDNRILEKAEKSVQLLAQEGKKEHLVQIIWTIKTQLGILTDAKSQYILFSLWRIAEENLPQAISVAAEKNNIPPTENDDETTTLWTIEETPPEKNAEVASWTASPDPSPSTTYFEEWKASYYAGSLQWNNTANGDTFTNSALTAAHKTLPFNTRVKVINMKNNHRVIVRINDRGPFVEGRIIDLSQSAFKAINNDSLSAGILPVTIEIVE